MKRTSDIQIRDPYVLPDPGGWYYLFGTTDPDCWKGPGVGFDCYRSRDLVAWEGPFPAFRPPAGFWATTNYWAPEAHRHGGRYYLLASFKAPRHYRGTQILASDKPEGPYVPLGEGPVTPPDWECLDGTLHVDEDGKPWMVFCHEWVQIHNGAVCAIRLSQDLSRADSRPILLFSASEAAWVEHRPWPENDPRIRFPRHVTDGPFLHRMADGGLVMLWSSVGWEGYAMGIARSQSGTVLGPWVQEEKPIWSRDGGHGMVFRRFDGQLCMTLHTPNQTPNERAVLVPVEERDGSLRVVSL